MLLGVVVCALLPEYGSWPAVEDDDAAADAAAILLHISYMLDGSRSSTTVSIGSADCAVVGVADASRLLGCLWRGFIGS
jgi:hypothetical protein